MPKKIVTRKIADFIYKSYDALRFGSFLVIANR